MSEFTVGDEVKIAPTSLWFREGDRCNPLHQVGVVHELRNDEDFDIVVRWPTQIHNVYKSADLVRVNAPADLYPGEALDIDERSGRVTTVTTPTGGTKHDNDKPDLSLTPKPALEAMAGALSYGKGKYGRDNYRNGFASDRLIAATLRHIHAWQDGEENDPESGVSHLGHALATLAMLLSNIEDGTVTDTRYKGKPK